VKVNDKLTLSGEVRHVKETDLSANAGTNNSIDGEGTLGAFKVGYDLNKDVNLYAIAQGTIEKKGAYEDNDLITLGVKAAVNNKLDVNAEVSSGDRGDSALIGANYQLSDSHSLYTNFTMSSDRTDNNKRAFTVGQRKSVTDQLKVYTEHQFTHENIQSGVGHTFGLDYQVSKKVTASASAQKAKLDKVASGLTNRDAFTVGLSYKEDGRDASTRLEYRRDKGSVENTEQWVTTNKFNYRVNPSTRIQGKLNYSETKDKRGNIRDAQFTEAQRWQIGGKVAHKSGEIRTDRDAGQWERNDATLAAARVRYHLNHQWEASAQYHWLNSEESQDVQHGAMISVDRHIGKNLKVGIGYNFTDFDDDLRNQSGSSEGWFINLVGKY